jgi:CHAT domain-containing protein
MADYTKALALYERALPTLDKLLGPQHPDTATSINNLAMLYDSIQDNDRALPLHERALAIREKILGSEHPLTSVSINNLACFYCHMGNYTEALPLFERALAIREKVLGLEHPDTAGTLNDLAMLMHQFGYSLPARNYAIRMVTIEQNLLQSVLLLDERSRLAWQKEHLVFWTACVLSPDALAQILLRQKGIVLDSLAEDRAMALAAGSSGEGAKILVKTKDLQARLAKIAFEQGKEEESARFQDEIALLQRQLATKYLDRESKRPSASMTMAEIMPALAGGAVLVDFIQFNDPKLKDDEATCLGAIITGEDNKPVFVRIDGGAAINRAIDSLRAAINQGNSSEVEAQTKFLSEKLWAPIAAKIPEGTKRLCLCPDANLNFLSFAALLESDGRFVAEKYPITYIGSARDLAKKPSGKISKSMALVANPQFDAAAKNAKTKELVAMRSAEADVFGSIALPPLPGTEAEAKSLQALAAESGWQTKSYLGKEATETSVRNAKKPGVLHLATHGFYLNSFTPPGPEGSRGMSVVGVKQTTEEKKKKEKGVDPMRASGVAFTGAQQTLTSWSQRKAPNPETDGVLTAEEVGALRLDGTWMVVLSACETGMGEARSGEGVFGLRRAFMIAGAENLLMTLWPVADETTAKIMTDFYKEAFATGDASGSLAKVQRDWLVKLRQERGLLAAVRDAGPFAMVTMTNPNAKREFVDGQLEVTPEKAAIPKSDKILEFQVALAKANSGDAYAQAVVSIYYGLGIGCDQDFAKSKEYVMLSAKQQNPLGIYRLAEMRESGEGMDQNTDQANQLMQKAKPGLQKLANDPYAMTALAAIYERENPASPKVRELLTKASDMGYEPAQTKLSQIQTNP